MRAMVVTLEVSQFDKSALNETLHGVSFMRLSMSVTVDTLHPPIDPCFTSAAAWSAQNSASAAASSALVASGACGGGKGGGEEGGGAGGAGGAWGEGGSDGGNGGGSAGGGDGGNNGGNGGDGGGGGNAGGNPGEHAPKPLQAEPQNPSNSALPAHAQRMRTLFASDKASVP